MMQQAMISTIEAPAQSCDPLTIILVEDDDADAKAIHRAMKRGKIANSVLRVCDGVEALELLTGKSGPAPSRFILLTDLNMPRMNGFELLQELRRHERLKKTVAFILTTSSDDRDVSAAYDLNAAGYIVKEQVGYDFINLVDTLDGYWKVTTLPDLT